MQVEASTLAKLQSLAKEREESAKQLAEEQAARIKSEEDRAALDAELKKLQAEIAAIKVANQKAEDIYVDRIVLATINEKRIEKLTTRARETA